MRHWTAETDAKAAMVYRLFSEAKIRKYQSLAEKQMETAYHRNNEDALADLQALHDALSRELLRRTKRN